MRFLYLFKSNQLNDTGRLRQRAFLSRYEQADGEEELFPRILEGDSMRFFLFAFIGCWTLFGAVFPAIAQPLVGATQDEDRELSADRLFDLEHIVDVQIKLPTESWDEIRYQSRDFAGSLGKEMPESPFEYVKGDVTIDGVLIREVGIRKKGFLGSLDSTRPSLKIKFAEYVEQDPVEGLDRLTLNNNKQDPGVYCQYLAYKLFRDSGTVAPRCNFARVTVNGEYLGLYSNVESIRREMLERNFGDGDGALWEGTVTDFFPEWIKRFEKKNKRAKYKHLRKVAELLAEDVVDLEQLSEEINIEAFVNFWAMESLMGFWDGYCSNQNNFFMYRNPEDKKLYFIPWGTDSCFSKTTPLPPYRIIPRSVHAKSILCNKLYRIPEVRKLYEQRLMDLIDKHWNEDEMLAEIERLEKLLGDQVREENEGFLKRSKRNREFVSWRRDVIMREFKKGPPELASRERTPIYFERMGSGTIEFETNWYDKTPRKIAGLGDASINLMLDGEVVELEDVGVYAERSKWPSQDKVKPASIVIVGKRKSTGQKVTLGLGVADVDFQPTGDDEDVDIGGILILDNAFVDEKGRMTMIGGRVKIDEASTEEGAPVKGSLDITITRMKGGDEVDEEPAESESGTR